MPLRYVLAEREVMKAFETAEDVVRQIALAGLASLAVSALPLTAQAAGCPAPGTARSLGTTTPASINFANSTASILKLYWLDFQGQRKFYADIRPGQSYRQGTYMHHLWIAIDPYGNCRRGVIKPSVPGNNWIELK